MHFRRLTGLKPAITYIVMHAFLGCAILNNSSLVGALALLGIYLNIWPVLQKQYRTIFATGVAANFVLMEAVTLWFASISPAGWLQKIGPLDTRVWLLIVVGLANLLASCVAGTLLLALRYALQRKLFRPDLLTGTLVFASFIMATDVTRSLVFAIGVHGNNTPFRPFWGIFSSAILIINPLTHNIPPSFGFWGSSFFFSCAIVVLYQLCKAVVQQKKYIRFLAASLALLLVIVVSNAAVPTPMRNSSDLRIVAVSRPNHATDYIDSLSSVIEQKEVLPTIVVLPEYDNLITPDTLVPPILANYNRWQKLQTSGLGHTYFAGTQDAFYKDTRYTQNYLVNGQREYVQRSSKQFLVPGGEYVIGWVDKIFQIIDPEAAGAFAKSRGRYAISNSTLQNDLMPDTIKNRVAIGACSSTLYPSGFQNAIKHGADVIAINISYQQFQQTKQYERFANTFMDFMAHAYQRPVISGADYGEATLHTASLNVPYRRDGPLLTAVIPRHRSMPMYALLGDTLIVSTLLLGTLLVLCWQYRHNRK